MTAVNRIIANLQAYTTDAAPTFAACWLCSPRPEDTLADMCAACKAELALAVENQREMEALLAGLMPADRSWSDLARDVYEGRS